MNDLVTSLIRTWTPIIAGAILAWLTSIGIEIDKDAANALGIFLTALFSGLYYLVARLLEKGDFKLGSLLLLSKRKPDYRKNDK